MSNASADPCFHEGPLFATIVGTVLLPGRAGGKGSVGMAEVLDWKRRLEGKEARKALADLYGAAAESQAKRYLGLAESALRGEGGGVPASADLRFYSAPGRTELGGNHTDHNRGRVLCAAVDLDAVACVVPRDDGLVVLVSEGYPGEIRVELSELEPVPSERGSTAAFVRGVARGLSDYMAGRSRLRGFSARVSSRVLPGSGLSSSAAFEVLLAEAMADLAEIALEPVEAAKIGQYAENAFFGKPCGLEDQAASAVGGIITIDFADPSAPIVERVDYDFGAKGYELVIVNTGGSHADLTPEYAAVTAEMRSVANLMGASYLREVDPAAIVARGPEIRRSCGDRAFLRALHFVAENGRVGCMVRALESDHFDVYLEHVKASGRSSWELLQNVYPSGAREEQGLSVALALTERFLGREGAWRLQGGGFAGTIQAYVPRKRVREYKRFMEGYFGPGSAITAMMRAPGAVRVAL